jgi:hypothetical protein
VAIDDHARIAFTAMHPDEKRPQWGATLILSGALTHQICYR